MAILCLKHSYYSDACDAGTLIGQMRDAANAPVVNSVAKIRFCFFSNSLGLPLSLLSDLHYAG